MTAHPGMTFSTGPGGSRARIQGPVKKPTEKIDVRYIALIHKNTDTSPTAQEWEEFIAAAIETGMFKGGSEIGLRDIVGHKTVSDTTVSVGGFMRFDSDDLDKLKALLTAHPVVRHGGTIELCEMPKS